VLSLARRAALGGSMPDVLAAGATIACAMMGPRIFLIVSAVDPDLAARMAWPLAAVTLAAIAGALYFFSRARRAATQAPAAPHDLAPGNPLDLSTALRFGAILSAIMIAARAASAWAGNSGLFVVAGISGLVDVDAISLSVATMYRHGQVATATAIGAILLAAAVNTVLKPAMALVIGGAPFGLRFMGASIAMIAAGAAALLIVARF
jgi:uncharacterized membrane protein (DUF4010 family)